MTQPRLPDVEVLADDLASRIPLQQPAVDATWRIDGPATAGKSTLIDMLAERLREHGMKPIQASPPPGSLDAGPCAMAELASGLKNAGVVNGETAAMRDPSRPLSEKLSLLREWIESARDEVVVMLDEPAAWPDRSEQTGHFADHARVVVYELVRDLDCRRVIVGDMPEAVRAGEVCRIDTRSRAEAFLGDREAWGGLAESASDLWAVGGERLDRFSPLELRLLVAHVAVTTPDEVARMLAETMSRRGLSRRLVQLLEKSPLHLDVLRAWRSLAEVRRPFSEELLVRIVGELSDANEELLRRCLLYRRSSGWVLHETLRRDVTPSFDNLGERLRALAQYYADESGVTATTVAADGPALVPAMESFYYAARAGARDLDIGIPYFVDQLDLLGKTLSHLHRDYEGACDVFAQAVELDEADDYAQHYLAFNLDRLGRDPRGVEEHYRRAIEINGRHPWWRARLISFLIVRGRVTDAELAWDAALDAFDAREGFSGVGAYETLHGWVAASLLRRGLLDFAERVLEDVPQDARLASPSITALIRRLRAFQIAERGEAFVPSQHLRDGWWKQGPFLLQGRIGDDDRLRLRRWLAGRIERIDGKTVELRVKEVAVPATDDPPTATVRLERDVFERLNRDPGIPVAVGGFVEVGLYSADGGEQTGRTIRVHPERPWEDDAVPVPAGAGDRYWLSKGGD